MTNYKQNTINIYLLDKHGEIIKEDIFMFDSPTQWGYFPINIERNVVFDLTDNEKNNISEIKILVERGDYTVTVERFVYDWK